MEDCKYRIGNFECGFYGEDKPLSSHAVLADVRALQEEAKIMSEVHPSKDARFFAGCVYKFLSEHFS